MRFDCIIIGGGIGGLTLSIQLAKAGVRVAVIEKEFYPFHKVCGEYISDESVSYLQRLGLDIDFARIPHIDHLRLSSISGITITRKLPVGGIGYSRYELDAALAQLAGKAGVTVMQGQKVQRTNFNNDRFTVYLPTQELDCAVICGCFGRKSNLDVQMNRQYRSPRNKLYVGVKYHITAGYDPTYVELHNFSGGYCGMSALEDGKINLSYITKAENLKKCNNNIAEMERTILSRNPYLKKYFETATFLMKPEIVSHVAFDVRSPLSDHILMTGDAAGSIAPLSGNGMNMAMRAGKVASGYILAFLQGQISRQEMEHRYKTEWNALFAPRIRQAKRVHATFGKPFWNDVGFAFFKQFPFLVDLMGKQLHGGNF